MVAFDRRDGARPVRLDGRREAGCDDVWGARLWTRPCYVFELGQRCSYRVMPPSMTIIQGIGGLGHLGIQCARRMGFRTAAIGRGSDKESLATQLGAHHYISKLVKIEWSKRKNVSPYR